MLQIRSEKVDSAIKSRKASTFLELFLVKSSHSIYIKSFNTECVHVASEEGDYSYKKVLDAEEPSTSACGLYILTDPDKVVEISIKYLDANCGAGALLAVKNTFDKAINSVQSSRSTLKIGDSLNSKMKIVSFSN